MQQTPTAKAARSKSEKTCLYVYVKFEKRWEGRERRQDGCLTQDRRKLVVDELPVLEVGDETEATTRVERVKSNLATHARYNTMTSC